MTPIRANTKLFKVEFDAVEEFAVGFTRSIRHSTSFWRSLFYTAFNLHVII